MGNIFFNTMIIKQYRNGYFGQVVPKVVLSLRVRPIFKLSAAKD